MFMELGVESHDQTRVTSLLGQLCAGNRAAADELLPLVYDDLRARARRYLRGSDGRLQPTELVHEAYLRLVDQSSADWRGRSHFFAVAAVAMRHIIIDQVRHRNRAKRGGDLRAVTLDDAVAPASDPDVDVFALYEALERLAALDPRQASIVEMRFFGGLSVEEVAEVLGVSKRTVEGEWSHARAWLRVELGRGR
jgi:RNA polymerase sigma factor (TIGR02999 family)